MQEIKNKLVIDSRLEEEIRIACIDEKNEILEYRTYDNHNSMIDNIYLAKVEYVKESIEAVFVKLDDDTTAFLSLKQISPTCYTKTRKKNPKITDLIKRDQKIIVQVTREPTASKLANVSTYITLRGKSCVFFPISNKENGISKQIKGEDRIKIRELISNLVEGGSVIIRTAATHINFDELKYEYDYLVKLWFDIKKRAKDGPQLLLQNDGLVQILTDYSIYSIRKVVVNTSKYCKKIREYSSKKMLNYPKVVFDAKNTSFPKLESQIETLYAKTVNLNSGASIIIEQTEALVSIDVNSKFFNSGDSMEETAFETNFEAAHEIVKQIILRNLAGIIIIDFIDMNVEENISKINSLVKSLFKKDTASMRIVPISLLGIMQISRQRMFPNVMHNRIQSCKRCQGDGYELSDHYKIIQYMRECCE